MDEKIGLCSECPLKLERPCKCGLVYQCALEVSRMDVTYFCHDKHAQEINAYCPLKLLHERTGKNFKLVEV